MATESPSPESLAAMNDIDCELVIGLVGAVGSDLRRTIQILKEEFERIRYQVRTIKISQDVITLFSAVEHEEHNHFERISRYMDAGNLARSESNEDSILALGAASVISQSRQPEKSPSYRRVTILDSLKRPEEVTCLRTIYPGGFFLFGAHADEERRRSSLIDDLGMSASEADILIKRDANERLEEHGQRVEGSFFLSDFFVRLDGSDDRLRCEIRRIIELIFGHPFRTPSFDEYAMFFSFAAALRSADLSRQVGAVIARDNQILATGANDCPRAGGGLYWPERNSNGCLEDAQNGRDYMRGRDSNVAEQEKMIERIIALCKPLDCDQKQLRELLSGKSCPIRDLTEYGRVVHAEMDALTSCTRSGLSTREATLYCTTFPCHNCAKHIIAAGIVRVVYIEPYEKSKAPEFHQDSVTFGAGVSPDTKVRFEPFVGVGPRRFFDLFSISLSQGYPITRKESDGTNRDWQPSTARPRLQMLPSTYLDLEWQAARLFDGKIFREGGNHGA